MRVLFVQQDHVSPTGPVGEAFADRGFDTQEFLVVPEEHFHQPSVTVTFPDPLAFDAIVPMGAAWSVYDHDRIGTWIGDELDFLRRAHDAGVPVLGICFGGQVTARRSEHRIVARPRTRPAPTEAPGAGGAAGCHPERCPCPDGNCTLSRVTRAASPDLRPGQHRTLPATEAAVSERLAGMTLDMLAMAAVSNIYRAAGAVRNHFERTVLAPHSLTWTGWVVLWVVWIWEEIETRHVAAEAGISKGTLTGVAGTLEKRGLLERRAHPEDARRVLLRLTPPGLQLMAELFPLFNQQEALVVESLSADEIQVLATALRKIVVDLEGGPCQA